MLFLILLLRLLLVNSSSIGTTNMDLDYIDSNFDQTIDVTTFDDEIMMSLSLLDFLVSNRNFINVARNYIASGRPDIPFHRLQTLHETFRVKVLCLELDPMGSKAIQKIRQFFDHKTRDYFDLYWNYVTILPDNFVSYHRHFIIHAAIGGIAESGESAMKSAETVGAGKILCWIWDYVRKNLPQEDHLAKLFSSKLMIMESQ